MKGYWNGWSNFKEWAEVTNYTKTCNHCGNMFVPSSANQKHCSREDNPECDDDRLSERLWNKGKHPLQILYKIKT